MVSEQYIEKVSNQYNGLTIEEARVKAQAAGFTVAIEQNGIQQLDCEFRRNRITFKVENGIVVFTMVG